MHVPLLIVFVSVLLVGCATRAVTPREYLDETTAATITVVAEPWVFAGERSQTAGRERDFLSLYAIDVNRMGEHRQYLAVLQWWPLVASSEVPSETTMLELETPLRTLRLQPSTDDARALGVVQPLVDSYTPDARWWYFPVDKELLAAVASSSDLRARLVVGERRTDYTIWRDGSAELTELTAVLP